MDDVRRIALSLPEVIEKPWYGTPGFRVKGKGFLRHRSNDPEGGLLVWVPEGEKDVMLASEPKKFFTTDHYKGTQTVIVNLKAIGVRELREVITESWRQRAPDKVLRAYGDQLPGGKSG